MAQTKHCDAYYDLLKEYEQFVSIVSHDLRAPLRHIGMFSEMLLDDLDRNLTDEQREFKAIIFKALKRANVMIDELTEFSRMAFKPIERQSVLFATCLDEALDDLSFEISDKKAEISVESKGDPSKLDLNVENMSRALKEIIQNSLKFQPEGQIPRIQITIEPFDDGNKETSTQKISIKDNGIGIQSSIVGNIFSIFKSGHLEGDYDGNGAGLAFAKKIVDLHGGQIKALSDGKTGAEIQIFLK